MVVRKTKDRPEFLLLHYGLGHWDFPKGNIEKGEKQEDTVRREIAEETGITRIKFIDGFRETIKYFYKWKGQNIFKIVVYYLVETRQKNVTLSDEHQGYAWLPYTEAFKKLTFKNSKDVLNKAMKCMNGMSE
ncbi:MAG: NUDIX domain-containing protein [Ignavibacteriae bacterium]|nr:NUDIX domain-containing protein [Ignavibacteriota bacterium]